MTRSYKKDANETDDARQCVHGVSWDRWSDCAPCQAIYRDVSDTPSRELALDTSNVREGNAFAERTRDGRPGDVVVTRVRGERRETSWRVLVDGSWQLTDAPATEYSRWPLVTVRRSAASDLLGDLLAELTGSGLRSGRAYDAAEWAGNVALARRIVGTVSLPFNELLSRLVRQSRVCAGCHSPILVGFKVNGRRQTAKRGTRYCEDACRVRRSRTRRR